MAEKGIHEMKKIIILGIGYVGLPTALMLVKSGYKVVGVDINKGLVDNINKGIVSIKEKNLQELFDDAKVRENFSASGKPEEGDVFIIAVPTPITKEKKCEFKYVNSAFQSVLPFLKKGSLIIIESTVPPLTCQNLKKDIEKKTKFKVGIVLKESSRATFYMK